MYATFQAGSAEVIMLEDGAGPFFSHRESAFAASAEQWARADAFDPEAVTSAGRWLLRFRCFAVRLAHGRTILVDAGIGPADSPAAAWAPVPGRLPDALAQAGIERDDVDTVVLTHLHTDHVGWAVTGGKPFFGNARYLLQAEVGYAHEVDQDAARTSRTRLLRELRTSGGVLATPHLSNPFVMIPADVARAVSP
jgi:glyoxylase-like metal-dependent hydrolase (beta-lactamase superfamily II)